MFEVYTAYKYAQTGNKHMSVEALGSEDTGEVIELFGVEALLLRRKQLQQRLGGASVRLNEASREYHDCIQEIIQVNGRLLAEGVDTNALGRELQREVPANAAVNDYGNRE